ncbi:unnamed protein product [Coregonus sp. 'balchen']|nr:unnamed protein product [Coregonus sp. 'balchen']
MLWRIYRFTSTIAGFMIRKNLWLYALTYWCAVISEMREGQPMDFPCNMEGHYLTIFLPGREKYLTLCEVEVYGGERDDPSQS